MLRGRTLQLQIFQEDLTEVLKLIRALRDYLRLEVALDQYDREHSVAAGRAELLVHRVVCVDEDTTLWPACDLGNLRLALNTLVRAFGMRD